MKKTIQLFLLAFLPFSIFSQAPDKINYQGVARDAGGNPIITAFDIHFIIKDNTNNNVHDEIQTGIQPNTFGIFNTQIGLVTPISPTVSWQSGAYTLSVSIKTGATFTTIGTQQLASVPFALYAQRAGNALPTATVNGSTLRWDQTSSSWKTDTNIINNGSRVNIGNRYVVPNNKFVSVATNGSDSAAVFGFHKSATDGMAGVRGFAAGSSSPSSTLNTTGILGGHFLGFNLLGQGIGVLGQGYSGANNGIGVIAIGSSNSTTPGNDYAVGLYATTDPTCTTQNRLAGVFDLGNVVIRDTLQLDVPGSIGQVLTRWNNGKAIWQSIPTSTAAGSGWALNGNTGTTAGTDFIGTSDATALVIKTNGIGRIGINTSTNSISGGVVIGGNTGSTSLGRALTLQGLLSTSDVSDQTYGHLAIRGGNNATLNQAFMSFDNQLGGRSGFLGDYSSSDADIYLNGTTNLRLTANNFTSTPAIFIDGTNNNVGFSNLFPGAKIDINNTTVAHALLATQNNSNETAIINNTGNGTGIYGSTGATSSATNPAIFGQAVGSSTNNAGVYGLSSVSSGVKGLSQSSNGVWGESTNNIGVFGLTTGNGGAGKFLLQGTGSALNAVYIASNSTPPALKAESFSTGAAIEARHSNSTAGSSNAALLLNDGHLAATGTNINATCFSTSSAATTVTATKQSGSNDVRGEVVGILSPAIGILPGQLITITVNFDKQYAAGLPHVMLEAMNAETATLSRYISGGSGTGFTVTFKNTGTASISTNAIDFKYFVIE